MPHPVIFFSVDGMRPDGLVQADTPCIDNLMATGSWSMNARTVMPSVTLPCHTSMHRGVDVPRHGITTNTFQPLARPVPGLFDVAKENNLTTGMFYNWGELRDLMEPASPSITFLYNDPSTAETDWIVARAAAEQIAKTDFDLVFVYLGFTDTAGHDHGWMSQPYIDAIANADRCIKHVLDAYKSKDVQPDLLILSDHGGHERSHGTEMPEDMTIPWVMHGPSIRQGNELTQPIRIFDACPTVAHLAGLPAAKKWDGRVVAEAISWPLG
jgi:predicted AlkP superfamily pyrophosphatase or phosphodiesterase